MSARLALVLLAAAAAVAAAEKCGPRAAGKPCADPKSCCNKHGWCGDSFCALALCISGACGSKPSTPPPPSLLPRSPLPKQLPSSPPPKQQPKQPAKPADGVGALVTTRAAQGSVAMARCGSAALAITAIVNPVFGNVSGANRCNSTRSFSAVAERCLGKPACSVAANQAVFGEPCKGLTKALTFQFRCGPKPAPGAAAPAPRPKPSPKPPPKPLPKTPPKPSPRLPPPSSQPSKPREPSGPAPQAGDAQYSRLWGAAGERWSPASRLADHSYAGYMANEAPIPDYPARFNARDFGAVGNGVADDSAAIQAALDAAAKAAVEYSTTQCTRSRRCIDQGKGFQNEGRQGVAVVLPAGTYRVTKMLEIFQSNVVLRGAGVGRTVLHFPKGLQAVYGNKMQWAFMGGYLTLHGRRYDSGNKETLLADLTQPAVKGQRRLYVSSTAGFKVGSWVRLFARTPLRTARRRLLGAGASAAPTAQAPVDPRSLWPARNASADRPGPDGFLPLPSAFTEGARQVRALGLDREEHSRPGGGGGGGGGTDSVQAAVAGGTLDAYLYGENAVPSGSKPYDGERVRFASRVAAVGPGWVELERPLPYDMRLGWQPGLYSFATPLQHSGFEDFTIKFDWAPYPAHMKVVGNNGVWMYGAANCWMRRIHIVDADTGAEAINSDFITMQGISFEVTKKRGTTQTQDCDGHHGLWAAASSNVRILDFDFRSRFVHDLTLDVFAQECVYHSGRGVDMSLDMHRAAVHNNLLSNINVGAGTRPFSSSGDASRGSHAAANNTWWNIHSSQGTQMYLPPCTFGPLLTFVGGPFGPPGSCERPVACRRDPPMVDASLLPPYCPAQGWYVEQRQPGKALKPNDVFEAQLARRLGLAVD